MTTHQRNSHTATFDAAPSKPFTFTPTVGSLERWTRDLNFGREFQGGERFNLD
jgi:hypothetical protein